MAHDIIPLGTVPSRESSADIGKTAYAAIAFLQCRRFIVLLRDAFGLEPEGARLRVRRSEQAFDPYMEVVVEYDDQNNAARTYALRCEREAPKTWRARWPIVSALAVPRLSNLERGTACS